MNFLLIFERSRQLSGLFTVKLNMIKIKESLKLASIHHSNVFYFSLQAKVIARKVLLNLIFKSCIFTYQIKEIER